MLPVVLQVHLNQSPKLHLKDKVFRIVCERNLCSYMNNTKWNELITSIKSANRQKNIPLNSAFSLNAPVYDEDDIDILGILEINSYNGNEIIQINIKDIRKSY